MAAEAYVVFEVIETTLQGAALGAIAVSSPSVPVHCKFNKIKSPDASLGRTLHSLNVVKGRAYIFGGDSTQGPTDDSMNIITLPTDLTLSDTDFKSIKAEPELIRPLAAHSTAATDPTTPSNPNHPPQPRSAHASTTIDSTIYIFGGRPPSSGPFTSTPPTSATPLDDAGTIHAFSTQSSKWTTLTPHPTRCSSGHPQPRIHASMTSTPYPLPSSGPGISPNEYGTLFLHGGYDANGKVCRDLWTFDVSSRVWTRWPDLPEEQQQGAGEAEEGQIICTESRLWRVGGGRKGGARGKMAYLEIVRDDADDGSGKSELGVSPKTGEWKVLEFRVKEQKETEGEGSGKKEEEKVIEKDDAAKKKEDMLPVARKGAGFVPVSTGAGREYLLYFMGEDAQGQMVEDSWTFQVKSDKASLASLKDRIRGMIGWKVGENVWAKAEVVQSTKEEGPLERPEGLSFFAADAWKDFGGAAVVLWGGKNKDGEVKNEGWVMTVD